MSINPILLIKLTLFALEARKDPEKAAIRVINDFQNNEKSSEIINGLREMLYNRYSIEDVRLTIVEDNLELSFHDVDESFGAVFASDVYDIFDKVAIYIPDDFSGTYLGLVKEHLTTISFKDRVASIKLPVPSKLVLDKLKEVLHGEENYIDVEVEEDTLKDTDKEGSL